MAMPTRTPRLLAGLAATVCSVLLLPVGAQEGTEFRTLSPPQPTESPGKIEVVEFFSYACPHCGRFNPLLNAWAARQSKDVVMRRVPVGFNREPWINLQRAYYALQASGDLAKLDGALFKAIHEDNEPLFDERHIAEWVGRHGGNAEKFAAAYASFNVNNQTVQADAMAERYGIDSVPTLAVNGEYVAMADGSLSEPQYQPQLLANTDKLIARVRAERAAAKPKRKAS
jgi:protein dithiol oxidoreductase (disulfide-forming)